MCLCTGLKKYSKPSFLTTLGYCVHVRDVLQTYVIHLDNLVKIFESIIDFVLQHDLVLRLIASGASVKHRGIRRLGYLAPERRH